MVSSIRILKLRFLVQRARNYKLTHRVCHFEQQILAAVSSNKSKRSVRQQPEKCIIPDVASVLWSFQQS